ncbi:MAG: MarR family winged helix-turn-helix transcriptional regulator [Anaerolineae bacterium]
MRHEPQPAPTAEEVAGRLLRIHRHLRAYAKQVSAELGISGRQLAALRFLSENGPQPLGHLAAHLYIADSTASELVDTLAEQGLVTRARRSGDARVADVTLTSTGEAMVARAPLAGIGLLRQRLRGESPERLAALAETLDLLAGLMEIDAHGQR